MAHQQLVSVSCTALSETILQKANILAKKTQLPFSPHDTCTSRYILNYTNDRLQLEANSLAKGAIRFKPLSVDFLKGAAAYRHGQNLTIKQPMAKAVGIKSGFRPDIFDATAGLGYDAFVFAGLGCRVMLNERSLIIGALLEDGLERAALSKSEISEVISFMTLNIGDAVTALGNLTIPVHTVYLDPMYPHSAKSALCKIEMRIIRDIVGDNEDAPDILHAALEKASNRVVVKRPKGAEYLANMRPSHETLMKNSRFDVYLVNYL